MSITARGYYPTDLSDGQWALIAPLLPEPKSRPGRRGRPPSDRHQLLNGVLYVVKTGCQWRWLPREFGPWQTVYGCFNRWSRLTT